MKKRYVIGMLFLIVSFAVSQKSFAKYIVKDTLNLEIFLDKTPPIIEIMSNGEIEAFTQTQTDSIKKASDITVYTKDNVEIKYNEFYYHPDCSDFSQIKSQPFEDGTKFTEEGYYRIITVDTSDNQTEVVILLDKSAPEVFVQYFKKGQAKTIRQTAGIRKYRATENILNTTETELETENVIEEATEEQQKEIQNETTQIESEIVESEEIEAEKLEEKEIIQETEEIPSNLTKEEEMIQAPIVEESDVKEEQIDFTEDEVILMSVSDMYVGNEAEFRNALANQAKVIHIRQGINFTAPVYINYAVTIVNEAAENVLRYRGGGSFLIVVQNGGALTIQGMVIDVNSSGATGVVGINIEAGGRVTFLNSSIMDGGQANTGFLVNGGGTLVLNSSEIVRCGYGINLQTNGNLYFGTQEGRCNNFYWNQTALFIDNFFGTCNLNQNISMHDNKEYAIYIGHSSGNINISSGTYYQNTHGIRTCHITGGSVTVSGGSYYSNGWAIWVGGSLKLTNATIYNNYYGVIAGNSHSGKFTMTGGNIHSNNSYEIYHEKTNDEGCTITGGTVSGQIYLATKDNYVNTNSSYPKLTVTPSSYYFKRKLVKTSNHNVANTEITNVNLTSQTPWYKYVSEEYIVLWSGGNVIVRSRDYDGNILKQETLNGTIGANYSVTPPTISGYDLISTPSNIKGSYTQKDIFVDLKYDLVNIAKVNFEDLLSGVTSAKYWYNANSENFIGNGTNFANGTIFEKYGFYKVVVRNGVGLEKEMIFPLNKNSIKR